MARKFKNVDWDLADRAGHIGTWQNVEIAVLMDIRDELHILNRFLHCPNFRDIPRKLERIAKQTQRPGRATKRKLHD